MLLLPSEMPAMTKKNSFNDDFALVFGDLASRQNEKCGVVELFCE
jgi:hypothetical protein